MPLGSRALCQYPSATGSSTRPWYTGFGRRPLQISFSDLDPGTHNRDTMRNGGCLVEVNAATNIYGFAFEGLMSQLPLSFPMPVDSSWTGRRPSGSGVAAQRIPFDTEKVYVEHEEGCS